MKGWPWGKIEIYMKQKECDLPVFFSLQKGEREQEDRRRRKVRVGFLLPCGGRTLWFFFNVFFCVSFFFPYSRRGGGAISVFVLLL